MHTNSTCQDRWQSNWAFASAKSLLWKLDENQNNALSYPVNIAFFTTARIENDSITFESLGLSNQTICQIKAKKNSSSFGLYNFEIGWLLLEIEGLEVKNGLFQCYFLFLDRIGKRAQFEIWSFFVSTTYGAKAQFWGHFWNSLNLE